MKETFKQKLNETIEKYRTSPSQDLEKELENCFRYFLVDNYEIVGLMNTIDQTLQNKVPVDVGNLSQNKELAKENKEFEISLWKKALDYLYNTTKDPGITNGQAENILSSIRVFRVRLQQTNEREKFNEALAYLYIISRHTYTNKLELGELTGAMQYLNEHMDSIDLSKYNNSIKNILDNLERAKTVLDMHKNDKQYSELHDAISDIFEKLILKEGFGKLRDLKYEKKAIQALMMMFEKNDNSAELTTNLQKSLTEYFEYYVNNPDKIYQMNITAREKIIDNIDTYVKPYIEKQNKSITSNIIYILVDSLSFELKKKDKYKQRIENILNKIKEYTPKLLRLFNQDGSKKQCFDDIMGLVDSSIKDYEPKGDLDDVEKLIHNFIFIEGYGNRILTQRAVGYLLKTSHIDDLIDNLGTTCGLLIAKNKDLSGLQSKEDSNNQEISLLIDEIKKLAAQKKEIFIKLRGIKNNLEIYLKNNKSNDENVKGLIYKISSNLVSKSNDELFKTVDSLKTELDKKTPNVNSIKKSISQINNNIFQEEDDARNLLDLINLCIDCDKKQLDEVYEFMFVDGYGYGKLNKYSLDFILKHTSELVTEYKSSDDEGRTEIKDKLDRIKSHLVEYKKDSGWIYSIFSSNIRKIPNMINKIDNTLNTTLNNILHKSVTDLKDKLNDVSADTAIPEIIKDIKDNALKLTPKQLNELRDLIALNTKEYKPEGKLTKTEEVLYEFILVDGNSNSRVNDRSREYLLSRATKLLSEYNEQEKNKDDRKIIKTKLDNIKSKLQDYTNYRWWMLLFSPRKKQEIYNTIDQISHKINHSVKIAKKTWYPQITKCIGGRGICRERITLDNKNDFESIGDLRCFRDQIRKKAEGKAKKLKNNNMLKNNMSEDDKKNLISKISYIVTNDFVRNVIDTSELDAEKIDEITLNKIRAIFRGENTNETGIRIAREKLKQIEFSYIAKLAEESLKILAKPSQEIDLSISIMGQFQKEVM